MTSRRCRRRGLAALALLLLTPAVPFAQSGIDCECGSTGAYVGPDEGAGVEISQDTLSPNGVYRVEASGTGPYDVVVRRVSDNAQVYATNLPNGFWGFSPDDHRFLYHYLLGGAHNVVLVDLAVSPAQQRWSTSVTTGESVVLFSPFGTYVMYGALTSPNHASLTIVEAATGDVAWQTSFTFQTPSDPDADLGMSGWGFSPDTASRSFVYAYATGSSTVQWSVVNLESGTPVQGASLAVISAFWQFSPCGDVIGIVRQTGPTIIDAELYRTRTGGAALSSQSHTLAAPVEFRSTSASHILKVGATDHVLSANVADDACAVVPSAIRLEPRSLVGGGTSTATVVLNFPAAPGGTVVSLLSGNTSVATVPPTVTVPAGDTTAGVTVQTAAVSSPAAVVVSATAASVTVRDTLTVLPITVAALEPPWAAAIGGDSAVFMVTLSAPAGPGGTGVVPASGNTLLATVPPAVTVPAGFTTAEFAAQTAVVAARDSLLISASRGGTTRTARLVLLPYPVIRMEEDTVVGGNEALLVADLSGPAPPAGFAVGVSSSDPSVADPGPEVTIPGGDTTGSAIVATYGVDRSVDIVITAHDAPVPRTANLHVLPARLQAVAALSAGGCTLPEGGVFTGRFIAGNPITVSVTLDGQAPADGAAVDISVDKPGVLAAPDTAFISGFERRIDMSCLSVPVLAGPEQVVLTATYRSLSVSDTIVIVPLRRYRFVEVLQAGEAFAIPVDLNNRGEVLISTPSGCHRWRDGARTPVPCGTAVNDSGWVAGTTYDAGIGTGFLWRGDSTIAIPHPDSNYRHSVVVELTDRGAIALSSSDLVNAGPTMFSIWGEGGMFSPGGIDPYSLNVMAMNDSGQAAGWADGSGTPHPTPVPFLWDGVALSLISLPADLRGMAWGINNHGVVVGGYFQATGTYRPSWFRAAGGAVEYFDPLPEWNRAVAFDVNDRGVVVGKMGVSDAYHNPTAFVFRDGAMVDLNCLTTVPDGWRLASALRINEAGDIIGGDESGGLPRAYLLRSDALTGVGDAPLPVQTVPAAFRLFQNYPNPFNSATTIRFELPEAAVVSLRVFDLLGREVVTLVRGRREAGRHDARFDASRLPSGVYVYRLQSGDHAVAGTMLLTK